VNNNFFKNYGSQIETVSVIVYTPITSLFKGAQLMNYAVLSIDISVLCCNKVSSTAMFYALFTLRCKIETGLGVFLQPVYTNGGNENKYSVI